MILCSNKKPHLSKVHVNISICIRGWIGPLRIYTLFRIWDNGVKRHVFLALKILITFKMWYIDCKKLSLLTSAILVVIHWIWTKCTGIEPSESNTLLKTRIDWYQKCMEDYVCARCIFKEQNNLQKYQKHQLCCKRLWFAIFNISVHVLNTHACVKRCYRDKFHFTVCLFLFWSSLIQGWYDFAQTINMIIYDNLLLVLPILGNMRLQPH